MRRVITLLVVAAATIAIAWWVAGLTGTVAATIAGYTIETTTPVAFVALVVGVAMLYLILRFLFGVLGLPGWIGRLRARRGREAGEKAVTRTLVALAAGDANAARSEAARARRLLGDTAQTLLHAAEAARLSGYDEEASALFRLLAERKDAGFLGLRGLFRQAMSRQDWAEAAQLGQQAEALRPGANWLRSERSELAIRTGNWQQAIALAAPGTSTASFAVAAAQDEPDLERAVRMARRAWKDHPSFVPAALTYAGKLRRAGREAKAQDVLRAAWKTDPHPDLAAMAIGTTTDPMLQLKEATRLATANPGHCESFFLLARLELATGQLAEARLNAEAARNAGMNQQRLWKLFTNLDASEPGDALLTSPQLDALRRATSAEADPGWRCEACNTAHLQWLPACPVCHTPGRIVWGTLSRPKLLASS